MNYLLIGMIRGAKTVTRTDKATKQVNAHCEVTVQFEDYDKQGELVLSVEHINFPISTLDEMKSKLNKFIAVPYQFISTPKGSWLFPNEDMIYSFYDKNPLISNSTSVDKKAS